MKKRYAFRFRLPIYILASLIIIALIVAIIFNILIINEVGNFICTNYPGHIASTVLSVFVILIVLFFMFNSEYIVGDKYLYYVLGVYFTKIDYKNIFLIREEKETHTLVINYKAIDKAKDGKETVKIAFLVVNIKNSKKDEFVNNIRKHNHSITYELFSKENE